jgi:hypothetical protein
MDVAERLTKRLVRELTLLCRCECLKRRMSVRPSVCGPKKLAGLGGVHVDEPVRSVDSGWDLAESNKISFQSP